MMVYWKFAWRDFQPRRGRRITITFGVAAILSAFHALAIGSEATNAKSSDPTNAVAEELKAAIRDRAAGGFDEMILTKVREVPGALAVLPLVEANTIMYVDDKHYQLVAVGIEEHDRKWCRFDFTAGELSDKKGGVLLDEKFAANAGVKLNQKVQLVTYRGLVSTNVVGFYKLQDAAGKPKGVAVLMPLRAAQHFFMRTGKLDSAQVVVKPGPEKEKVREAIQKLLPAGIEIGDHKFPELLDIHNRWAQRAANEQ